MGPDSDEFRDVFMPLFDDVADEEDYPAQRPLLAHYTSVETFEQVLKNNTLWFSNPLLMNDIQELRWGILEGTSRAIADDKIRSACETTARTDELVNRIEGFLRKFDEERAFDVYVFCFCRHAPGDKDGLLSMWRGYGASGGGVAVEFDTAKFDGGEDHPLVLARVHYASNDERHEWLDKLYARFAAILKEAAIPTDKLYHAAHYLFERLILFAIFSKHKGFGEEREWRAVYMPLWDEGDRFKKYFHYTVTSAGVHPKLKLPIVEIPMADGSECTAEKIISRIILGPTIASPLAKAGFNRMLDCLDRPDLKKLVHTSGIPFRRT